MGGVCGTLKITYPDKSKIIKAGTDKAPKLDHPVTEFTNHPLC